MVESGLPSPTVPGEQVVDIALTGWRYEEQVQPDGTTENIMVPLTPMEFLHPEEDYHFPNNTFHQDVICDARIMLGNRYWEDPTVAVFSDLLIEWDMPYPPRHCPDLFVVFGIRNKEQFRSTFVVANEAVRPALAIEVVAPHYRKEDRQTKVLEYEQVGITEYVIIDRRTRRGQAIYEVLGYRLVAGRYLPMIADDDGRIPCETIGLWVSMQDGRLVLEDMETQSRLLKSTEWKASSTKWEASSTKWEAMSQELSAENQELKAQKQEWEAQKQEWEARLRELEAEREGRQSS